MGKISYEIPHLINSCYIFPTETKPVGLVELIMQRYKSAFICNHIGQIEVLKMIQ